MAATRRSEARAARAAALAREGKTVKALLVLVDFADRGVNNHRTEELFKAAIREEFAGLEFAVADGEEAE